MISAVVTNGEQQDAGSDAEQRTRRAKRRMWVVAVGVPLVLVAIAFALFAGGAPLPVSSGEPPPWRENLGFAITIVAFVLIVVALVRMVRAQMFTAAYQARAWSLSIGQRRRAARWVRRGESAPEDIAQTVAVTAEGMARQRKIVLLFAGMVLNVVASVLQMTNPWWMALMVLAGVLMLVGMVIVYRDANLAQRWLDAHQEPATSKVAGS